MMVVMTPAQQHAQDSARFTELVEQAGPGDWERPSPVDGWTARDVVAHLIEWLPGFVERAGVDLEPVEPDPTGWHRRCAEVQQVLGAEGDREFESPMLGTTTVADAIDRFYTADVWMHSWDLARALGRDFDMGEQRCADALAGMEPVEEMIRESGQFGTRVPVPDDAPAQDRFLGFIGRDPEWSPRS